jgi:hypothetical protein
VQLSDSYPKTLQAIIEITEPKEFLRSCEIFSENVRSNNLKICKAPDKDVVVSQANGVKVWPAPVLFIWISQRSRKAASQRSEVGGRRSEIEAPLSTSRIMRDALNFLPMKAATAAIDYVVKNGKRPAVILPIDEYEELLQDLDDLAVMARRKNEPTIPLAEIKRRLKKKGAVRG